ncbi:hypothetical protein KsCSTR_41690 [Candidatus Kuenenia stuttgartiensis]|uniref:Uncharacterized protein n=1 Tax=Kuenenia stuttgartiensis TaxID=174633 RepID=Q1PXK4_KUEST|nr:hypothetical protein KsCSTR_41690 [Candidatus Kuenenia stuttgartiensis]CAJ71966.1 unknown protein [Candidatus Kuenenia stuttgartiensis]
MNGNVNINQTNEIRHSRSLNKTRWLVRIRIKPHSVTIQRKRYTARSQTPVWECICSRNSGFSPVC